MSETNHDVNVRVKTEGTDKATDDIASMGKASKKVHQQTMGQGKKELGTQQQSAKITKKEREERKREIPRELRELREKNKLFDTENKIRKEKLKLLANEERQRRRTFGGGFRGGMKDRLLPTMPRDRGEAGQMLGSAVGGALSSLLRNLTGVAVAAFAKLVAMPFAAIGEEYNAYRAHALDLKSLAGYAGGGATIGGEYGVDSFRKNVGQKLGYMPEEVVSAMAMTARATGSTKGTGAALTFSRLLGQDVGETTGMFGQLRQAGATDFTRKGDGFKQMVKAVAAGITTGLDRARLPEFLTGVMELTSRSAGRTGGDVSSVPFSNLLATLGSTGASGLQGARGVSVARALEEGFTNPGGGEEGRALALSAMGFGRNGPGGGRSFYDATKALEQGTTKANPQFIREMFEHANAVWGAGAGGGEDANLHIQKMLGDRLTLTQIEEVQKAFAEGKDPTALLEAAMETERDVLVDIRTLLSGGDDDLLHEARRQSDIANENITAGAQLKESLENMHDIMREFITEALPAVADTLRSLSEFMTEMRPVLRDLAGAMNSIAHWLRGETEVGEAVPGGVRGETRLAERGLPSTKGKTPAEIDYGQLTLAEDRFRTRITADANLRPTYTQLINQGEMPAEDANTPRHLQFRAREGDSVSSTSIATTRREDRLIALADTLARGLGYDQSTGPTDTSGEVRAMLSFLLSQGLNMPPSVRAILDRTGGPT